MTTHVGAQRLTALDAAFLDIESDARPIHVGSVGVLEGAPLLDPGGALRIDDLRDLVSSRLDLLPRFRSRVVVPPAGVDRPWWVEDAEFDIARHVETLDIRDEGVGVDDDEALRHLAERIFAIPLDRTHPLWHLLFVTGLTDGRVGLIERAHHALVDGVSGVDVATVLLDFTSSSSVPHASDWEPEIPLSSAGLALDAIRSRLGDSARVARDALASVTHPLRLMGAMVDVGTGLATALTGGLAPRSSLNAPTGANRDLAWIRADLAQLRAAEADTGATINDVILSAIAAGLRALAVHRGEPLPLNRTETALVPVSVRSDDGHGALGNRVSALLVRLPIGIGDPDRRLRSIVTETRHLKDRREAHAIELMIELGDLLPPGAVRTVARSTNRQPFVNLVVTNVAGPDQPLYLMGARLIEAFPFVPLGGNLTLEVALLSYDGTVHMGVTADRDACPDLAVFTEGVEGALARLGAPPRTAPAPAPN